MACAPQCGQAHARTPYDDRNMEGAAMRLTATPHPTPPTWQAPASTGVWSVPLPGRRGSGHVQVRTALGSAARAPNMTHHPNTTRIILIRHASS
eukprot:7233376-Prymnesium_polylepis.2